MSPPITPRAQPDKALNGVLQKLREDRGLSREQLAHEAGITVSSYNRLETGRTAPGWWTVRRVAQALGVSMAELGRLVDRQG